MNKGKDGKNTEISARIARMIEILGQNPNSFAKKLGYKRAQTIYDIVEGKSAPSYDFFNRFVVSEFSVSFNLRWLLAGEGEPLADKVQRDSTHDLPKKIITDPLIPYLQEKDNIILKQAEEIGRLKERIRVLEKEGNLSTSPDTLEGFLEEVISSQEGAAKAG